MADDDAPRDPFLDEGDPIFQGWGYSLRKGEMVFQALSELPSIHDATRALGGMSESDLKCMVLERLFKHHVGRPARVARHRGMAQPSGLRAGRRFLEAYGASLRDCAAKNL